jgi:hypothetical protein
MPVGIEIINDSGSVLIDSNWRNFGFRSKFSVTITAYYTSPPNPPSWLGQTYHFTTPGTAAQVVACKASLLRPVKLNSYFDGANWTHNWCFLISGLSTESETVEFYIFDVMEGTASNVGIEIFNEAGERAYHSDFPVMKIGGVQGCDNSFAGVSGRTYVPLIMRTPILNLGSRPHQWTLRSSGNLILTELRQYSNLGSLLSSSNPGRFMAVDVTGL